MEKNQCSTDLREDIDSFTGAHFFLMEERITTWLDSKSISITDPLLKQNQYYDNSKKKVDFIRSMRSITLSTQSSIEESYSSLQSLSSLSKEEEEKNFCSVTTQESFLMGSNTWKLKNRRKIIEVEQNVVEHLEVQKSASYLKNNQ